MAKKKEEFNVDEALNRLEEINKKLADKDIELNESIELYKEGTVMWTRKQLKEKAKAVFRMNYWRCVLAAAMVYIGFGGAAWGGGNLGSSHSSRNVTIPKGNVTPAAIMVFVIVFLIVMLIGLAIAIMFATFLWNPLDLGICRFFLKNLNHNLEQLSLKELLF